LSSIDRLITRSQLLSVFRERTPGALVPIQDKIDGLLRQINTNAAFKPFREAILSGRPVSINVDGAMLENTGQYAFQPSDPSAGRINISSRHTSPESLGAVIIQEFHHREYSNSDFGRTMASALISDIVNQNLSPSDLARAKATFDLMNQVNNEVLSEIKELIYWRNVITERFQRSSGNASSNIDLESARNEYIELTKDGGSRIPLFNKIFPLILDGKISDANLAPLFLQQGWEIFKTDQFFRTKYIDANIFRTLDAFRRNNPGIEDSLTFDRLRTVTFKREADDGGLLLMPEGVANREGTAFNVSTDSPDRSLQFELQNGKFVLIIFDRSSTGEWVGVGYDGETQSVLFVSAIATTADGLRSELRTYVSGKTEAILFDEAGLEFSRTSRGSTNGEPYERVQFADGRVAETLFDNSGVKTGTAISQSIGTDTTIRYLDAAGAWLFTVSTQPDDNGFQTRVTETPNGRSTVELLQLSDPNNPSSARILVSSSVLYKESNGTVTVVERYNASNELLAIERTSETVLANGQLGTRTIVINAITREQATTITSRDGTVESTETTRTLTPADNQRLTGLVSGLGELNGAYQQWLAGNKLQGVLQLSSGTVNILQATGGNEIRQSLGGVSASLGAINQLLNLDQVFGSGGNEFGKLSATVSAVNFANNNINRLIGDQASRNTVFSPQLSGFLNGNGQGIGSATSLGDIGVLPVLNLVNGIRNKDPFATISGVIGLVNPSLLTTGPVGWILAGMSILYNATKEPPIGWGVGKFTFTTDPLNPGKLTVSITGESFGVTQVRNTLEGFTSTQNGMARYNPGLRDYLYTMVNQTAPLEQQTAVTQGENRQNDFTAAVQLDPNAKFGVIAQRLPSLSFMEARGSDGPGFKIDEIDPLTGQQVRSHLRWDDNWAPYNATVGNNTEQESLMPALMRAALARGAIAPIWEVRTAELQQSVNDPFAGLTEEERAARQGFLAKTDAQGKPISITFRPIVLDINSDGQISRVANADSNVAFDWDDSGFNKQVDWVSGVDGFLALDRDLSGSIDSGRELFSNAKVGSDMQGLRSMYWVDANGDGRINADDPVFNELRVWRDLNGDGKSSNDELNSLAYFGISEIEYGSNRITRNNNLELVDNSQMSGDATGGQRQVRNGILVETQGGTARLHISNIGSAEQTITNGQGFSAAADYQEVEEDTVNLSFTLAELLSNDSGFNGSKVGIEFVNIEQQANLTATWNAQTQAVDILLDSNFNGRAGLTYVIRAPNGSTIEVPAIFNVSAVDDPVTLRVDFDPGRNVYGYDVLVRNTTESSSGNGDGGPPATTRTITAGDGVPIYEAFTTIGARRVTYTEDVDVSGNPVFVRTVAEEFEDTGFTLATVLEFFNWNSSDVNYIQEAPTSGTSREFLGWEYFTSGPQYLHDTVITVEKPRSGQLVAEDPDNPGRTYEFFLTALTNSKPDGINLLSNGRFEYKPSRYVGQDQFGFDVNGNVGTDKETGINYGAFYIRSEANLDPNLNYDFFAVGLNYTDPDGTQGTLKPIDDTVDLPHYGQKIINVRSGSKKPIAIDLNGDGFHFTDVDDSNVFYAVNETGWRRRIAWINPTDGLIAYDKNGDGKIDRFDEISFVSYAEGAATDLEGLRAFDTNNDGQFTSADASWNKFGVWQDANSNGVTDSGEFIGFDALGMAAIGLSSNGQFQIIDGQTVHGTATATLSNGSTLAIADVSLNWKNETQVIDADGTTRVITLPNFMAGSEYVGTESDDITFGNEGNDVHRLGGGNDYVLDDLGDDEVDAGAGNDMIFTGAGNDVILAGTGDDNVWSGAGNDLIFADDETGAGNDFVMSGEGNDVVFGGDGHDFVAAGTGNDVVSGDAGDDKLFGESGSDALIGGDGADELYGGAGNDLLDGGDGNDLHDGGEGDDRMEGGLGNDTYSVDSEEDSVVEGVNAGNDTVYSAVNFNLSVNLENLTLTGSTAILGLGNSESNVLIGNSANNDLGGFGGNDVLDGGAGVDRMFGGEGDDVFIIDENDEWAIEDGVAGTDTVRSTATNYKLDVNVEILELIGSASINGTGNFQDNTIIGNIGDNRLDGQGGSDTFVGGEGNDTYVVDSASDVLVELINEGQDAVESSVDWTLAEGFENLMLSGVAQFGHGNSADNFISGVGTSYRSNSDPAGLSGVEIFGYSGNDFLIGSTYGDRIYGGDGDDYLDGGVNGGRFDPLNESYNGDESYDHMYGGAGNDTYVVDIHSGFDNLYEEADEGIDTVIATSVWGWTLAENFENLVIRDAAVNANGNAKDNLIVVDSSLNSFVYAEGGNDTVIGGSGNDFIAGQSGDDRLYGGEGNDTIDDMEGINFIDGGDGNDVINARGSVLRGGRGNDVFFSGGSDIPATQTNTYLFDLGDGNDTITEVDYSGSFEPNLDVTSEVDTIAFGAGITSDMVRFERTLDDFVLRIGSSDSITIARWFPFGSTSRIEQVTFQDGTTWDLSYLLSKVPEWYVDPNTNAGPSQVTGADDFGASVIEGWSGADRIDASIGDDRVYSEGGDDIVYGGLGNDYLHDTSGANQLFGGDGNDVLWGGVGNDLLDGGIGDDEIVDFSGENIVEGGAGNDTISATGTVRGGTGNDRYLSPSFYAVGQGLEDSRRQVEFAIGDGHDIVDDFVLNGFANTIVFGAGISPSDLLLSLSNGGSDMVIGFASQPDDSITWQFAGSRFAGLTETGGTPPINEIVFANGTRWSAAEISNRLLGNQTPLLKVPLLDQEAVTTRRFSFAIPADTFFDPDSVAPLNYTVRLDNGSPLPTWLQFDPTTLTLSGTPPIGGSSEISVRVTVTDAQGATVDDVFDLAVLNRIVGTSTNNTLNGTGGRDYIEGLDGNDTLNGGVGRDRLLGGLGNDTYVVDNVGDEVIERLSEGTDTVRATVDYVLPEHVENLLFQGAGNFSGSGNELNNTLTGNEVANTLQGRAGNDVLNGAGGDDIIYGDEGNDRLNGGAGADLMVGGLGNDTYDIDHAGDLLFEDADQGSDSVNASIDFVLGANFENLTLIGNALVGQGNELANRLIGNVQNNSLYGFAGNDTLNGGAGADLLVGGSGDDTVYVDHVSDSVVESENEGNDLVRSTISYTLTAHVERLTLDGVVAIDGTGNQLNNTITGNSATNTLYGLDGNDSLNGGLGADLLYGGQGNDTYFVNEAGDLVIELDGEGTDIVQSDITYQLPNFVENLTLRGTTLLDGYGNELANVLTGNTASNRLFGYGGDDTLNGGNANDVLTGGDGADKLNGSAGFDLLFGGAGNDTLSGGDDHDLMLGALGIDTLTGGNGNDFAMGGAGNDTIDLGAGNDLMIFNRGDGSDILKMGLDQTDAISLGGGIRYSDLKLSKSGSNLILSAGNGDQITLQSWYSTGNRRNVTALQMVIGAPGGNYQTGSVDPLTATRVTQFDFLAIVTAFDAARGAASTFTNWAIEPALTSTFVGGSDSVAIGGDLAWRAAHSGSAIENMDADGLRATMATFGLGLASYDHAWSSAVGQSSSSSSSMTPLGMGSEGSMYITSSQSSTGVNELLRMLESGSKGLMTPSPLPGTPTPTPSLSLVS
jgi:Ca2+-binding RTX toxin-like protein